MVAELHFQYNKIMNAVIIEIRAAEGGKDAKLLVEDQFAIYKRAAQRYCL